MEWKPTDVTILFVYCWISTCFGPTGPSSGEFVQLFTQPLVQFLYCSGRVYCVLWPILVTILYWLEWKPTDVTILFVYCRISTCFGPTGPSSGEFVQFTKTDHNIQSTRTEQYRYWTNGCVNSCTNSPEDGPVDPKHVEIRQYTNKIVTSVGFHSICWKDARYKKLKIFADYIFYCLCGRIICVGTCSK